MMEPIEQNLRIFADSISIMHLAFESFCKMYILEASIFHSLKKLSKQLIFYSILN